MQHKGKKGTVEMIDIHTHILPGVDDGAKDWDTCLEMLKRSAENGVEKVIATPHFLPWRQSATPKEIMNLCSEVQKKLLRKHGISMDIYCGNEIYYSMDAIQNLREGKMLTLAGSKYVLVEFEPRSSYQVLCRATKEFRDAGYIPIVAHMERYDCLRQTSKVQDLRDMGALFQMNVEALQGRFLGRDSQGSKKCLVQKQVDFLASDMHGLRHRVPLADEQLQWVRKKLNPQYQKALLYRNAEKILEV